MDGLDWKPSLVCVYPIRYDGKADAQCGACRFINTLCDAVLSCTVMPRWIMTVLKSAPGCSGSMVTCLLEVMNPAICPIMHRAQPSPIRGRDSNGTFSFF